MPHQVRISVIVPVFRVEAYLDRCVRSILGQTLRDLELVLVDDGSPDRCGDICDAYANVDGRVHVIHQKNAGLSMARNVGIEWSLRNSTSEWLFFVDSDDWIDERTLEVLYEAASANKVSIASIPPQYVVEKERPCDIVAPVLVSSEEFWCLDWMTATTAWGKLYRKELFRNVRFPPGKVYEDEFTTYKVLFSAGRIAFVNSPLYRYFVRSDGISGKITRKTNLIDKIEALLQQMHFFREHGNMDAYGASAEHYISYLSRAVVALRAKGRQADGHALLAQVTKRLKSRLRIFERRNHIATPPPQSMRLRLKALYPLTCVIRWRLYRLFKRTCQLPSPYPAPATRRTTAGCW